MGKMSKHDSYIYINGLKKFREKGINIYVDGKSSSVKDWYRMIRDNDENSYYMADYVDDDESGKLKEIRFERVRTGKVH